MKRVSRAIGLGAFVSVALCGTLVVPTAPASAQMAVFDGTNYAQNLLQAARALEAVNNQVKSLQNEAGMLRNMATNLKTLSFPQLSKLTSAMTQIDQLMSEAQSIQFKVAGLDSQVKGLFPGALNKALTSDQQVVQARAELDAATAAYRQAMSVQAQVVENVQADAGTLNELAASSQSSVGALQVSQAANQLMALSVKQQLQLQNLMASEYRSAAIDRARRAQAEEDGRAATRRFLNGAGPSAN
ncbi:MAG TPA: P-type conjugative transfer protein TrbJ [Sphingomicrobium sp.]|nr:P-type conjugative transfer protein TrbJ [Sphingomicrobium sp.]